MWTLLTDSEKTFCLTFVKKLQLFIVWPTVNSQEVGGAGGGSWEDPNKFWWLGTARENKTGRVVRGRQRTNVCLAQN